MIFVDEKGWLRGSAVFTLPCKHHSALVTPSTRPEGVVWHYTNTAHGTAKNMAERLAKAATANSSYHLAVESDGTIYQSVSLLRGSWHANSASAAKFKRLPSGLWMVEKGAKLSANAWTIGVEFVNAGRVKRAPDGKWRGWPYDNSGPRADSVTTIGNTTWADFTPAQIKVGHQLLALFASAYGIRGANARWTHAKIDPTRRTDPGPLWDQHLSEVELCTSLDD